MPRSTRLDYKVVAAFDTETTNINTVDDHFAFPILYQIGSYNGSKLSYITSDNVESCVSVSLYRHAEEAYSAFDEIINQWRGVAIPVVMVHNFGFDMYSISEYLNRFDSDVIAKSSAKPITIRLKDDAGNVIIVFWDTLSFTQKSLATMGNECGYQKAEGDWDYNLIRTPDTPLTNDEKTYSVRDVYALFAYMGYYMRLNTWLDESLLGCKVITKTGVVRAKRDMLFSNLAGKGNKETCGQMWYQHNATQRPRDDDELFTMHAVTRGGFTFTASRFASVPFDLGEDECIAGFDAASQHPAQMTGHVYPVNFHRATSEILDMDAKLISSVTPRYLIEHLDKPFIVAFNALFRFENLRLKEGSVFERDGIAPLASERLSSRVVMYDEDEGNQAAVDFASSIRANGYKDSAINADASFGKLNSADACMLWLTELEFWIVTQCYDFDNVSAVEGYETSKFVKPTDYSVLSVMHFYYAKNVFKQATKHIADFDSAPELESALHVIAPQYLVEQMRDGTADSVEVEAYYQILKSDLNALYGIEITNEAKPDQWIDPVHGIVNGTSRGVDDLPSTAKTWYQFGQRIVGWSRVAQVIHIMLASPYVKGFVNGDTDSIKMYLEQESIKHVEESFSTYEFYMTRAREKTCARVKRLYPDRYRELDGMGGYELEFTTRRYCSAWNKAYLLDRGGRLAFTLAGVPTSRRKGEEASSYDDLANWMIDQGASFSDVANRLLGYNTTISHSVTHLNARAKPPWGVRVNTLITDYRGNTSRVTEPLAMALYAEDKIIGSTAVKANAVSARIAARNNPDVCRDSALIYYDDLGFHIEEF